MGPIFDANEEVKELLVLQFKASKAKTVHHAAGSFYLPEPFLETEVAWDSFESFTELSVQEAQAMTEVLLNLKQAVYDLGGEMAQPMIEIKNSCPILVWTLFFNRDLKFS